MMDLHNQIKCSLGFPPIAAITDNTTSVSAIIDTARIWGGLAEGVMYAILLMNALTPLINRYSKQKVFGTSAGSSGAGKA